MRHPVLVAALWYALASPVSGQTAFSASVESDARFRGVSLSDGQPGLRLNLDHDGAAGWYSGLAVTGVELYPGHRQGQWLATVGRAQRTGLGLDWEAGATLAHFAATSRYDYGELFAGCIGERWNLRAYLSPSYFGTGVHTVYAEINGGAPLNARWRWFGHAGTLAATSAVLPPGAKRASVDVRAGLSATAGDLEWQFARAGSSRSDFYAVADPGRRYAWVLTAVWTP